MLAGNTNHQLDNTTMEADKKIKIIVADDNKCFREALRFLIKKNKNWELIGEAENGQQLVEMQELKYANVVLLDLEMPEMDGLKAAKILNWEFEKTSIIAVTMYADKAYLYELITRGFKGFIFKPNIYNELEQAITEVLSNKYYFPKEYKMKITDQENTKL